MVLISPFSLGKSPRITSTWNLDTSLNIGYPEIHGSPQIDIDTTTERILKDHFPQEYTSFRRVYLSLSQFAGKKYGAGHPKATLSKAHDAHGPLGNGLFKTKEASSSHDYDDWMRTGGPFSVGNLL